MVLEWSHRIRIYRTLGGDTVRIGTLVRLGVGVNYTDLLAVVTKAYQDEGRPCCNVLFVDGCHGTLIYLDELEVLCE